MNKTSEWNYLLQRLYAFIPIFRVIWNLSLKFEGHRRLTYMDIKTQKEFQEL